MYLLRAVTIWLVIIAVETGHGILRTLLLAPLLGDFRARQAAVFTGSLLILAVAYFTILWIKAETRIQLLLIGVVWVVLTILFEFGLGRLVLNHTWDRLLEDYDLRYGGILGFGLLLMLFAPLLAQQLRKRTES